MICPSCEGNKEVFACLNTGEDSTNHRQEMIRCMTCNGDETITDEHAHRIKVGRMMRLERQARGETLMEAAIRKGMTVAQVSAIENGRRHAL